MKQKLLFTILATLVIFTLLTGCSSSDSKKSSKKELDNGIASDWLEQLENMEVESDWDSSSEQDDNEKSSSSTSKPNVNTQIPKPDNDVEDKDEEIVTQPSTPSVTPPTQETTPPVPSTPPTPSTPTTPITPEPEPKPEPEPEPEPEPKPNGVLIGTNIYGCGEEHTQTVNGITFHWYDRYERRVTATATPSDYLDISFSSIQYVVYELSPSWNNNDWEITYNATASRKADCWWKTYDADGYFIEEVPATIFATNDKYVGNSIEGKNRGFIRVRGISVAEHTKHIEFIPYL